MGRRNRGEVFDITPVLEYYDIPIPSFETGWKTVKCPFHDDRSASARVTLEDGGAFYCHACDAGGDAISLLIDREGLDRDSAISFYEEAVGGSVSSVRRRAPRERRKPLSGKERDWERGSDLFQAGIRRKPFGGS